MYCKSNDGRRAVRRYLALVCYGSTNLSVINSLLKLVESMGTTDRQAFEQAHLHAKQNHELLKGLWVRQEEYFGSRQVMPAMLAHPLG